MQEGNSTPATTEAEQQPVAESAPAWQYTSATTEGSGTEMQQVPPEEPVGWTASEYILHEKGSLWYVILAGAAVLFAALYYLLFRDIVAVVVICIVASVFGVSAARRPQTLHYQLDSRGITIGARMYPYASFKSFTLLRDSIVPTISLLSLQRFMPPISIHYPPEQEESILAVLSRHLPLDHREQDWIDRLMQRLRF